MSNPAETYERYMVPTLFAPWAARLVEVASPRPGERVLDLACGTGVVGRQVAARVGTTGRIVGIDLNPDMVAVARACAEREGLAIEWHQGRAESLPFPAGSFDLVLCQQGLRFIADRNVALAEVRRVLTPEGRVCLSLWQSLERHPFYAVLHEAIRQHLGMSALQQIFALGDATEVRSLLTDAGFNKVAIEPVSLTARFPDPEGFLAGEIDVDTAAIPSMQHLDAQARQAITAAISGTMAAPLRAVTEGDQVVMPFHAHLAHAR